MNNNQKRYRLKCVKSFLWSSYLITLSNIEHMKFMKKLLLHWVHLLSKESCLLRWGMLRYAGYCWQNILSSFYELLKYANFVKVALKSTFCFPRAYFTFNIEKGVKPLSNSLIIHLRTNYSHLPSQHKHYFTSIAVSLRMSKSTTTPG